MAFREIASDFQTTITAALVGSVAGTATNKLAGWALRAVGAGGHGPIAGDLIYIAGAGLATAAGFTLVQRLAPATADNLFFLYIYFSANDLLVGSSLDLARRVVGMVDPVDAAQLSDPARLAGTQSARAQAARGCTSC